MSSEFERIVYIYVSQVVPTNSSCHSALPAYLTGRLLTNTVLCHILVMLCYTPHNTNNSNDEKETLSEDTGLSYTQVSNWFTNKRKRHW
jgi:Homeobox KN domain